MLFDILSIVLGFAGLLLGGELLIRGSVSIASILGLSRVFIGAVIIGFGTSLPELSVSLHAALTGAPGLAIGNVVGSNIANILLIVSVASIIMPILVAKHDVRRDTYVMLITTVVIIAIMQMGTIGRTSGIVLCVFLIGYIYFSYRHDKRSQTEEALGTTNTEVGPVYGRGRALLFTLAGFLCLVFGGDALVSGSVHIARQFGVSEAVIGLTMVAIGTSLPELVTAVLASLKKHPELIIGNILGSNIFNILTILGITALITPIPVDPQIRVLDVWVMLAVTVVLAVFLLLLGRIRRPVGVMGLALYGYYIWNNYY